MVLDICTGDMIGRAHARCLLQGRGGSSGTSLWRTDCGNRAALAGGRRRWIRARGCAGDRRQRQAGDPAPECRRMGQSDDSAV